MTIIINVCMGGERIPYGPFDRKWVFGLISGNLCVYAPNHTLVFNTFLAKNAC